MEDPTVQDSAGSETEAKIKADEISTEKQEDRKPSPETEEKDEGRNLSPERPSSTQSRKDSESDRKSVDSRPKSSDSVDRPKSSGSGTAGRLRRGKKAPKADVTHSLTFKITVSLAIPTG